MQFASLWGSKTGLKDHCNKRVRAVSLLWQCWMPLHDFNKGEKLIQRHWRSDWEASSMLETVTQQLLPHWKPLPIVWVLPYSLQHSLLFTPCRESVAQATASKEYCFMRNRNECIHHCMTTHTSLGVHGSLKSFLLLTRAASLFFPKQWNQQNS